MTVVMFFLMVNAVTTLLALGGIIHLFVRSVREHRLDRVLVELDWIERTLIRIEDRVTPPGAEKET